MESAQSVKETSCPDVSISSNGNGEAVMNPATNEEVNPSDEASNHASKLATPRDATDVPSLAQGDLLAGNSVSTFSDVVTENELHGLADRANLTTQGQFLPTEISTTISSDAAVGKETEAPNGTTVTQDQLLQIDSRASTPVEDVSVNESAANHPGNAGEASRAEMGVDTSDGAQSQNGGSAQIPPVRVGDVILPIVSTSETVTRDSRNDYHSVPTGEPAVSQEKILTNVAVNLPESRTASKLADINRALVDTAAPFESVKEAVSKFGGIVDWKAHKIQSAGRQKLIERELEKAKEEIPTHRRQYSLAENAKRRVLKELDSTKREVEELKLSLERAQTEERQAKQDSELAKLRVEEMEQGIADEASVAAKAQLEVAKARHTAAVSDLNTVKDDLETLRNEYASLIIEKEVALKRAEEASSASKEVEKMVEELTIELIATKETLESAHAAHLEAEEQRIAVAMSREQDSLNWEKELKLADEELERLNQQILLAADLKSKLSTSSALLLDLKDELARYMELKVGQDFDTGKPHSEVEEHEDAQNDTQAAIASAKKELEEVKLSLEKETSQVSCLNVMASSLKSELEKESLALATTKQKEGMASVVVASLEAELEKIRTEIGLVQLREKEAKEKMVELPKQLQQAAEEADQAKLLAEVAQEELQKVKEMADQAKATSNIVESRLFAAKKEAEASWASEKLAIAAISALKESKSARSSNNDGSPAGVTLSLEEYYELSKRAHEAEEAANERVAAATSDIEAAKVSESKILERLEEVSRDLAAKKEELDNALEKAETAKAGKLAIEHELREWRAEHELRRRTNDPDVLKMVTTSSSPRPSIKGSNESKPLYQASDADPSVPTHHESSPRAHVRSNSVIFEALSMKKKKKALFPKIFMFFARRKVQKLA